MALPDEGSRQCLFRAKTGKVSGLLIRRAMSPREQNIACAAQGKQRKLAAGSDAKELATVKAAKNVSARRSAALCGGIEND